ncbi:MAG: excisionase family DNA-binding protein [Acidobacteriota bacterium]
MEKPKSSEFADKGEKARRNRRWKALSTGQAARFCYVTSETILNWIRLNQLRAQRTAGGQYRIRLTDLRQFMVERGMDTSLLDEEWGFRPYCWRYHQEAGTAAESAGPDLCKHCLVRRSGTLNCWELHALLPLTARRVLDCSTCPYYGRFAALPLEREAPAPGQGSAGASGLRDDLFDRKRDDE